MDISHDEKIISLLIGIISDGFNRSMRALEEAGAIDRTRMQTRYMGVGTEYYDLVSEQIQYTAKYGALALQRLLDESCPNG